MLAPLLLVWTSLARLIIAQTIAHQAYTPVTAACPDGFILVRQAGSPGNQTLCPEELAYMTGRKVNILPNAWKIYLTNLQAINITFPDYVVSIGNNTSVDYPNLGIVCSGGGWRATMFGTGLLNVLDGQNKSSVTLGTGRLPQVASYITRLSGGSSILRSLIQADFL